MTLYEATQRQRALERAIRKGKRELLAFDSAANAMYGEDEALAGLRAEYSKEALKLKQARERLKAFEKQAGLMSQPERAQVYGFGRSEASRAVWGARKVAQTRQEAYNNAVAAFKADIASGKQTLRVIPQKQLPHLVDTAAPGRSYIIGELEDAQRLVDRYAGTGAFQPDGNGRFTKREIVKTDMRTGIVQLSDGDQVLTSWFKIHYRNTGTHIVPLREE